MERAILSVDGNCGCALLGENLQEGEVEERRLRKHYPNLHGDSGLDETLGEFGIPIEEFTKGE